MMKRVAVPESGNSKLLPLLIFQPVPILEMFLVLVCVLRSLSCNLPTNEKGLISFEISGAFSQKCTTYNSDTGNEYY